jgi:hypothetical protein
MSKNLNGNGLTLNSELELKTRKVLDEEITTLKTEFWDCCALEVEVGTNGFHGGDSGHGGRVFLGLKNLAGTGMLLNGEDVEKMEMAFAGDAEIRIFLKMIDYVKDALELQLQILERTRR